MGWLHFFSTKYDFSCLFTGIWVKNHFSLKAQLLINFKSLLISLAEVLTSWTTENKEVSSANYLHSLLRPFDKSLTYIKNERGPRMESCGTPARISTQEEHWPFKTTCCFLFLLVKKSFIVLIRSPHIRSCIIYINQVSRKRLLSSG